MLGNSPVMPQQSVSVLRATAGTRVGFLPPTGKICQAREIVYVTLVCYCHFAARLGGRDNRVCLSPLPCSQPCFRRCGGGRSIRHMTSVPRGVEKTLVTQCMRAYE